MSSKDFDGKALMILGEGQHIAIVVGDRSYLGTLQRREENWFVKLTVVAPGEPDEIKIHKIASVADGHFKTEHEEVSKVCEGCERHEDRIFGDGKWVHVANFGGSTSDCFNPPKCEPHLDGYKL